MHVKIKQIVWYVLAVLNLLSLLFWFDAGDSVSVLKQRIEVLEERWNSMVMCGQPNDEEVQQQNQFEKDI